MGVALMAVKFYRTVVGDRRDAQPEGPTLEETTKAFTQHLDRVMADHFDQLRRDLETKIEKEVQNAMTREALKVLLQREGR